jgi:uncharacterized membrane protein YphA (DoxX/SURF4 family)
LQYKEGIHILQPVIGSQQILMMFKRWLPWMLCYITGALFIFSGISKIDPIEPFELTFVDIGFNWKAAPFIARFIIGSELFIGTLLLINLNLRKLTYKLAISTLLLFSIYLIMQIIVNGNKGNCGCFGSYFPMTPLQALIKNIIMIGILIGLSRHHGGWELKKRWKSLIPLSFLVASALPFILNTIELNYSQAYLNKPENNFKLPLDSLQAVGEIKGIPKELSKGKHIIAFLSLSCPHCRIAANKLRIIHQRSPQIPVYFVLNGDKNDLNAFREDTRSENIPYALLEGRNFFFLAGFDLPAIYMTHNSMVENQISYPELNEEEIKKWLAGSENN